jgi:hypothetical protein
MVGVRRPFPQGFRKQLQLSSRQILVILHDDFCDEATNTLEDQPLQVHVQQSQHFSDFRTNKQLTRLMSHFIQVADTFKLHSSPPYSNTAPTHTLGHNVLLAEARGVNISTANIFDRKLRGIG